MSIASPELVSRQTRVRETSFTGPFFSALQIAAPNARRIALIIANPGTSQLFISTSPTVADNKGIMIAANAAQVSITMRDHGGLVSAAWYVGGSAATACTVIEVEYWTPESEITNGE